MPETSRVAQRIVDGYTSVVALGKGRFVRRPVYRLLRRLAVGAGDPLVSLTIGDRQLWLPASHQLPLIRAAFPQYGENLVTIAREAARKYPGLRAIDVGANVGDTAFLISAHAPVSILCVEGDPEFLPLLRRNLESLPGARIVESYVGFSGGRASLTAARAEGTARLIPDAGAEGVELKPLEEIVEDHPDFASAKLLKIDTDGFDSRIIHSAATFLARTKPAVFFEYSPYWSERTGDDAPRSALGALEEAGYASTIVYKNTGDFLRAFLLADHRAFDELLASLGGPAPDRYFDIAVFHAEDEDLSRAVESHYA